MEPKKLLAEARELVSGITEQQANLIRHAANYFRRHRDLQELGTFLRARHYSNASDKHWQEMRKRINEVLTQHSNPEEIAYILGWAWRLRRVYGAPPGARGGRREGVQGGVRGESDRRTGGPRGYGGRGQRRDQLRRDEKRW
ncbi:MAG: hypothetical protein ABIL25_10485 [candidate division WOR-3 bacterium]